MAFFLVVLRSLDMLVNTSDCNWFVLTDSLLANGGKLNLILPKSARALYFFSRSSHFLALHNYQKKIQNISAF